MKRMERNGLGTLFKRGEEGIPKETFFKLHPQNLNDYHPVLVISDLTLPSYTKKFNDHSKLRKLNIESLVRWHPGRNLITTTFDSTPETVEGASNVLSVPTSDVSLDVSVNTDSSHDTSISLLQTRHSVTDIEPVMPIPAAVNSESNKGKGKGVGKRSSLGNSKPKSGEGRSSQSSLEDCVAHSTPVPSVSLRENNKGVHDISSIPTRSIDVTKVPIDLNETIPDLQVDDILSQMVGSPAHSPLPDVGVEELPSSQRCSQRCSFMQNDSDDEILAQLPERFLIDHVNDNNDTINTNPVGNKDQVAHINKKGCVFPVRSPVKWSQPHQWQKILEENAINASDREERPNENIVSSIDNVSKDSSVPSSSPTVSSRKRKGSKSKRNDKPPGYSPPQLRSRKGTT